MCVYMMSGIKKNKFPAGPSGGGGREPRLTARGPFSSKNTYLKKGRKSCMCGYMRQGHGEIATEESTNADKHSE